MCNVQASTDPAHGSLPTLAVNGDTDSFALCPSTAQSSVRVVYKPANDSNATYVFDECYPVRLHMVALD